MVVLTPDNDQVLAVTERLDANIMIGIACIPDERVGNQAFRHPPSDRISPVGNLFRVDRDLVIDRRIGRKYGGASPDHASPFSADLDALTSFVMGGIGRVRIEPA